MVVVRFRVQCQPGEAEQVMSALGEVVGPSRALTGVISFDIGRDVTDRDVFIATEVFEDRAALDRQAVLPEVAKALAVLEQSLAAEPEQRSSMSLPRRLGATRARSRFSETRPSAYESSASNLRRLPATCR